VGNLCLYFGLEENKENVEKECVCVILLILNSLFKILIELKIWCCFFFFFWLLYIGSKHNPKSQKGHQMLNITSQNQRFIYVLPFETMAIITTCSFFIQMNVKKLKLKIHLIQF
jgi:hypothetical protein